MTRRAIVTMAAIVALVVAGGVAYAATSDTSVSGRCPTELRTALPLPRDALTPAISVAIRYADQSQYARQPGVVEEAIRDPAEGSYCGGVIGGRTVLVRIGYPQFYCTAPRQRTFCSGSLAYGTKVLISRFPTGYRVWFQLH